MPRELLVLALAMVVVIAVALGVLFYVALRYGTPGGGPSWRWLRPVDRVVGLLRAGCLRRPHAVEASEPR